MTHSTELLDQKNTFSITLNKFLFFIGLLIVVYFSYTLYVSNKAEQAETSTLIVDPQVNDIYFLDYRHFSNKLGSDEFEHKNKYKLAKVIRVSDDNITVVYGRFSYQWQYAVINSIKHGDLSNNNYFTLTPGYIPLSKMEEMKRSGALYLIKRPIQNKLYGNFVSPQ